MKKVLLLLLFPLIITSCLEDGSNYITYTGRLNIDSIIIPDSARVGETVDIRVKGGAPNGCWSLLELSLSKKSDSVYYISGSGLFESTDGICTDIYQIIDSTFTFKPEREGKYMFIGQSPNTVQIVDSLIVLPAL